MLTYGKVLRPLARSERERANLEQLLAELEANGMALWRLSREANIYVVSARSYAERGVRWQRARGRTPTEAVERLLRRQEAGE